MKRLLLSTAVTIPPVMASITFAQTATPARMPTVSDSRMTTDGQASYFVVGAGGFLGMGQHDVAIPFDEVQRENDRLTLRGYTKDPLKAVPKVALAE